MQRIYHAEEIEAMPITLNWQIIELNDKLAKTPPQLGNYIRTERAAVVGGWLVRTLVMTREVASVAGAQIAPEIEFETSVGLTFVPDPTYSWK